MGYLAARETDQLWLPSAPDTYWVRMKKRVEYGDSRAAQTALLKVSAKEDGSGEVATALEVGAFIGTLTVCLITEWNVTDENDQVLPITVDNLDRLSAEDGEFLAAEAQRRKAGGKPEDRGPFPASPNNSGQRSTATKSKTLKLAA